MLKDQSAVGSVTVNTASPPEIPAEAATDMFEPSQVEISDPNTCI
tara:strand:+ start:469 stop:603 length:135 start_codon:yes stop_codon:yes gene_type:complete